MTLFNRAKTWLSNALQQGAGEYVSYRRGDTITVVRVVVGRTVFRVDGDAGVRIEFGDRDYLIDKDEFPYAEPAIGDRITETVGGQTAVYEVLEPGTGDPAWRWSDPQHQRYRIHTKRVT
jgi:hypothetical protein